MKKLLAALALSSALLMSGCAGTASAQPGAPSTAAAVSSEAASTPAPPPTTQTATTQAAAAPSASPDGFSSAVAQGLKDKIAASAGDTKKYLPAVRATVKKGTDAELIDYGVEVCTAVTGEGVNQVISEMTSKGYTKDNAAVVAMSAGFFICPTK